MKFEMYQSRANLMIKVTSDAKKSDDNNDQGKLTYLNLSLEIISTADKVRFSITFIQNYNKI